MENVSMEELERMRRRIIELAEAEKVPVKEVECVPGPSVSLFKVYWQDGVSPRRLSGFQEALEFHEGSWRSHPVRKAIYKDITVVFTALLSAFIFEHF